MRFLVSSNCITGGLSSAVRILFPGAHIDPLPYSVVSSESLSSAISNSDFTFFSGPTSKIEQVSKGGNKNICTFPEPYFNAFHPDQVYAWFPDGSLLESSTGPYNSAIALWSWQHGLSADQTTSLFRPEIMEDLGYHRRWAVSVERLKIDFAPFPHLDYRDFLEPLQRGGSFMHTVNHPKVSAIAQLARVLARQIDPNLEVDDVPLESMLVDTLFNASFAWSIYPSVANALGFTSQYLWKREDHSVIGLDQFIHESFARYDEQQPHSVECHELSWPIYDQVLLPASQGVLR